MKKEMWWVTLVFSFLFVSSLVFAATQKIIIDVPGSFVLNGKNITVLGLSGDKISVDVDGVVENVEQDKITNESKFVNGVYIQIIALSKSPSRAVLNIIVNINCGNNVCENGEDFTICCADCGCSTSKQVCSNNRCVENITKPEAKHQCFVDSDCDDKNTCTTEKCDTTAYPNKCIRTDVTACVSGDKCCPKSCDTDKDADCAQVDKCDTDSDCVDNEACTKEACVGKPKRCQFTATEGCTYEKVCIKTGTVKEGKYCEGKSHEWLSQKVDGQSCKGDSECLTAACAQEKCGKTSSKTLTYAFYTIALIAIIMVLWYLSLSRKTKGSSPSSGQP